MENDNRIESLLQDILETQQAHLDEYRRVTAESLATQREAVEAQARHIQMYRSVALAGGVIVVALIALIVWLMLRIF